VHEARAAEILKAIKTEKPEAVLMDKNLGSADGLALLREIRADADIKDVPVIIASGEDVAYQCKLAGANDFMLKPYSPDQLSEALKKVIPA
jgi:CheY-like chemotaxis protein